MLVLLWLPVNEDNKLEPLLDKLCVDNSDGDTEGILQPGLTCKDPFRSFNECNCLLVLCDTYDKNGNPLNGLYYEILK